MRTFEICYFMPGEHYGRLHVFTAIAGNESEARDQFWAQGGIYGGCSGYKIHFVNSL
jgi:hypothetical protein